MKLKDLFVNKDNRFSLGVVEDSARYYLSIPVSNSFVDYEEYYEISQADFNLFQSNTEQAAFFADECRSRMHDNVLIIKPGSDRGCG